MEKYITYFKSHLVNQLSYRFNFFTEYITSLIAIIIKISLWSAIVTNSSTSLSLSNVVNYFILVFFVSQLTTLRLEMANKIKTGALSNEIIRPVNPMILEFSKVIAVKLVSLTKFIPIFIFAIWIYNDLLKRPHISLYSLAFVVIALIITFLIQLFIQVLAFWMTEVGSVNYLITSIMGIFSGSLIPYEFLPNELRTLFEFLPFKFIVHIPVSALLGDISLKQYGTYFLEALFTAMVLILIIFILYRSGLKKYTAAGA
jgi:ABC-2 type transport system permease protein